MNGRLLLAFGVICTCLGQVLMEIEDAEVGDRTAMDAPYSPDIIKDVPRGRFPPNSRSKRQAADCGSTVAAVTDAQKSEIIDAHNQYRRLTPARNELRMVWSDSLASRAQDWANQRQWAHGMLTTCAGESIGQNMYLKSGGSDANPAVNYTEAVKSWNSERAFWDFNTQTCQPGKVCGHFTQLVGASSGSVGCAVAKASSVVVSGATWNNCLIYVCNYSPAGNVRGESVFLPGERCTACTTVTGSLTYRGYKCEDSLCVPCTPQTDQTCQCGPALDCQNGGSYLPDSCVCKCTAGFFGTQCENSCTCSDLYGDTCGEWKDQFCDDPDYLAFMTTNCANTCGLCNIPASCLVG